jgi:hypothetical protein
MRKKKGKMGESVEEEWSGSTERRGRGRRGNRIEEGKGRE